MPTYTFTGLTPGRTATVTKIGAGANPQTSIASGTVDSDGSLSVTVDDPGNYCASDGRSIAYAAQADDATTQQADLAAGDGGSGASGQAGSPIVRAFPFAYDTAGLTTGVEIWTPAPGDILFDVWFEVDTAWNGTTPLADVGQFLNGETGGLFSYNLGAVDLTFADRQYLLPTGLLSENGAVSGTKPTDLAGSAIAGDLPTVRRWLPAKFLTDDPVKIVVSTTGANDGDDPGATQGAGVLYLHTVTPVTA